MSVEAVGQDLRRLLGADAVSTDRARRVAAGTDFVTQRGIPAAVARPTSADQVAAALGYCAQHGIPVVTRGAATNLSAAMMPGDESLVLDLAGMNRIVDIDAEGRRAVVEPGVVNADLKSAVAPLGLNYAPDPASSPISTIGGNIAENAGGPGCIKYGVTFHHVTELDVVLADGRLVTLRDSDPIDLLGVMIGSEGTLGVVTRVTTNLVAAPASRWTALLSFDRLSDAAHAVSEIVAAGIVPAALEFCDRRSMQILEAHLPSGYPTASAAMLVVELDGDVDEVAYQTPRLQKVLQRWDPELRVATDERDRTALWAGRLAAGQAVRATGNSYFICDSTVPRERVPEMVAHCYQIAAAHQLDIPMLGHAGDGNIHPIILYQPGQLPIVDEAAREITDRALQLGGTLTGEHGVGTAKREHMHQAFSSAELGAFRAVKRAFDPHGLLNPGVLLPEPTPAEPDSTRFHDAVGAALCGAVSVRPDRAAQPTDATITIDRENMSLTAGGAARCGDVTAAARAAGVECVLADDDARTLADVVESDGSRQPVRRALLGITATSPDGHAVRFGSSAMKDVAGLDAKRLVAGSRGAFGRVQAVTVRTVPRLN